MIIKYRNEPEHSELQNRKNSIAVEKWRFKTALIALATSLVSVFATASVINLNIGTETALTPDKALVEAQDMYYSEKYTEALSLYQEFATKSGIASLNLGYMYSKGLGCKKDFEMACQYYKQAYSLGIEDGLNNYLAVNLLYPNSYEDTLEALRFGVENNHISSIKYVAFLETDIIFVTINDEVRDYATNFLKKSTYSQTEVLKTKEVVSNRMVEYYEKGIVKTNSEFREYIYIDDTLQTYIGHYTSVFTDIEGKWVEKIEPVYEVKECELYCVNHLNFQCAEYLFSEDFYKI